MAELSSCGLIVLAAGASSRMGQPKQLLPVNGRPLLRQVVDACIESRIGTVIVVLGSHAAEISPLLDGLAVHIAVNAEWSEGMGSSVRAGMKALSTLMPTAEGVVVTLADQPRFSAQHVIRLFEAQSKTGKPMVASRWDKKLLPPAFFAPAHFVGLRSLRGDAGARSLFQLYPDEVGVVDCGGLGDLDTQADYAAYLQASDKPAHPP